MVPQGRGAWVREGWYRGGEGGEHDTAGGGRALPERRRREDTGGRRAYLPLCHLVVVPFVLLLLRLLERPRHGLAEDTIADLLAQLRQRKRKMVIVSCIYQMLVTAETKKTKNGDSELYLSNASYTKQSKHQT